MRLKWNQYRSLQIGRFGDDLAISLACFMPCDLVSPFLSVHKEHFSLLYVCGFLTVFNTSHAFCSQFKAICFLSLLKTSYE